MSADTFGLVVAVGLPLAVLLIGAIFWPEPMPRERTVKATRQHIQDEDSST
ncbi:hypothetical protein [Nocardia vaccinii]|uniref:hypothetical protein n=1 Tax=Nocardia vaccinii TaxID=1822 RepID=UPI000AF95A35|nr:hypothetical protein [Nocardia vaccinii]